MRISYRPDGYIESIRKGQAGISRFRGGVYYGSGDREAEIARVSIRSDSFTLRAITASSRLSTAETA